MWFMLLEDQLLIRKTCIYCRHMRGPWLTLYAVCIANISLGLLHTYIFFYYHHILVFIFEMQCMMHAHAYAYRIPMNTVQFGRKSSTSARTTLSTCSIMPKTRDSFFFCRSQNNVHMFAKMEINFPIEWSTIYIRYYINKDIQKCTIHILTMCAHPFDIENRFVHPRWDRFAMSI